MATEGKKISSILLIAAIISITALKVSATSAPEVKADGPDENLPILKIMSFNLRYGIALDGPNSWDNNYGTGNRKAIVVNLIENYRPTIIGTQEGYEFQLDYLAEELDNYRWFGVSRRGSTFGEYSAIFYDNGEVELKENGNFWLSNTPEEPASVSWENVFPIPRMVTWGKFELRGRESFYVFNTHFSATSVLARVKSAELLHQRASEVGSEYPVFMIGDFNAPGGSQVWEILTGDVFEDAWEVSDSKSGPEFTSHDFKGPDAEGKERIDWILSNSSKVRRVETVTFNENGKYPSDHFPVYAEIELTSFEVKKEIPFTLLIGGIITAAVIIIVVMYGRYRLV